MAVSVTEPSLDPAAMVIDSMSSVASPTTSSSILTSPSAAATGRLAVAVTVEVSPSIISVGSAVTLTVRSDRPTVTSADTVALLSPDVAVTVILAEPAETGVSVSIVLVPLAFAPTAAALD